MDKTKIFIYILFIILEVFTIAFLEETYKKVIRKDKYKNWECTVLGLILSAGATALLICSDLIYPVFSTLFGANLWLDHLVYFVLFYFSQLKLDSLIIKNLIKSFVAQWLKSNLGITLEELQILTKSYKSDEIVKN